MTHRHSVVLLLAIILAISANPAHGVDAEAVEAAPALVQLTDVERAELLACAVGDYRERPLVNISGKRLHQIIDHPQQYGPELAAAAIVAHEIRRHRGGGGHDCWDATFLAQAVAAGPHLSPENVCGLAEAITGRLNDPHAAGASLRLLQHIDYAALPPGRLRARCYQQAGWSRLRQADTTAAHVTAIIADYTQAIAAWRHVGDAQTEAVCWMERIKVKMRQAVYEGYRDDLDADFDQVAPLITTLPVYESLIGSYYHTRGLHDCNQATRHRDLPRMRQAREHLQRARHDKERALLYVGGSQPPRGLGPVALAAVAAEAAAAAAESAAESASRADSAIPAIPVRMANPATTTDPTASSSAAIAAAQEKSYPATLKILGDIALRLVRDFNDEPLVNLAIAQDAHIAAIRVAPTTFTPSESEQLATALYAGMRLKGMNNEDTKAWISVNILDAQPTLPPSLRTALHRTIHTNR